MNSIRYVKVLSVTFVTINFISEFLRKNSRLLSFGLLNHVLQYGETSEYISKVKVICNFVL